MPIKLHTATPADVPDLLSLRTAVNGALLAQHGPGMWIANLTEKSALFAMRHSSVYVARRRGRLIATLALATKKPWAIDTKYFTAGKRPLYLTSMAVHPASQRTGIGRTCLEETYRIARQWPADAIRLDAYDAAAGAGDFYSQCGFREVGRVTYRNAPLIYFEKLLT